ncbi:MAG: hypothetical protein M0Q51_10060, partial [Bacteroidales bacterium]|nr:hypothetical protein [Bacteroidales bacterium]
FGFPVARDTLAFGYKIPAITALFGLGGVYPRTIEIYYMPGTPFVDPLRGINFKPYFTLLQYFICYAEFVVDDLVL